MSVSAKEVKALRDRTGAGMMECKKALVAANGDIEKAVEELRISGQAKADKKSARAAAEGCVVIKIAPDQKSAVILEVNSETDFVARDENFLNFVNEITDVALANQITTVEALFTQELPSLKEPVEESRRHLIAKLGENIQVRRLSFVTTEGVFGTYVHGGRIGVLVDMASGDKDVAKDIAMHIAASRPVVVNRDDVSDELIAKEREIFSAQAQESGKPADIVEKMIEGRINKFLDEVSLMGQPFVKDPTQKIFQLLKAANAEVAAFIRYEVGEGIEKKADNFVEEVMSQVRES